MIFVQFVLSSHPLQLYIAGLFGSAAVEFWAMLKAISEADGHLPARYKRCAYVFSRAVFSTVFAAPLPILLSSETFISAFYIGASAPLFFDKLATGAAIANGKEAFAANGPAASPLITGATPDAS
jgi:hypothetical protein